jgi:hypothetical protein
LLSSGTQNKVKDTIESYRRTKNMLKDLSKNLKSNHPRTKSSKRASEINEFSNRNGERSRDLSMEGALHIESDKLSRKIQRDIA